MQPLWGLLDKNRTVIHCLFTMLHWFRYYLDLFNWKNPTSYTTFAQPPVTFRIFFVTFNNQWLLLTSCWEKRRLKKHQGILLNEVSIHTHIYSKQKISIEFLPEQKNINWPWACASRFFSLISTSPRYNNQITFIR